MRTVRSRDAYLTKEERSELIHFVASSKGVTCHGNRARVNAMLPLTLAKCVVEAAKSQRITISEYIVRQLENIHFGHSPTTVKKLHVELEKNVLK